MPIESLSNPFGSFRMGLYPPGSTCNGTTYYNTSTMETVSVPFVPCGQLYSFGELITSFNHNIAGIEV